MEEETPPAIRRGIEKYAEVLLTVREILRTTHEVDSRIERRVFRGEPVVVVFEREDFLAARAERMKNTHPAGAFEIVKGGPHLDRSTVRFPVIPCVEV